MVRLGIFTGFWWWQFIYWQWSLFRYAVLQKDFRCFVPFFSLLGLSNVGSQPTVDYGGTISLTVYCMYQLMFAIIAVSIVSGAIVERMSFRAWVIFAVFWTTLVYDFIGMILLFVLCVCLCFECIFVSHFFFFLVEYHLLSLHCFFYLL
jgi:ammonia channel protein AmtB